MYVHTYASCMYVLELERMPSYPDAACINIYLQFITTKVMNVLKQLSGYLTVIVNRYPDSNRQDLLQSQCVTVMYACMYVHVYMYVCIYVCMSPVWIPSVVEMLRISMTMQTIPVVDLLPLGLPMPVRSTGSD